jgi:hypothetical protein
MPTGWYVAKGRPFVTRSVTTRTVNVVEDETIEIRYELWKK